MLHGEASCDRCNQLADNLTSLRSDYEIYAAGAQQALRYRDKLIALLQAEIAALKARLDSGVVYTDRTTESSE